MTRRRARSYCSGSRPSGTGPVRSTGAILVLASAAGEGVAARGGRRGRGRWRTAGQGCYAGDGRPQQGGEPSPFAGRPRHAGGIGPGAGVAVRPGRRRVLVGPEKVGGEGA